MLRLPTLAHERAVALAQLTGRSIGAVVSEAIDRAYREAFWATVERQTAHTREHEPVSWSQYQAEATEWDEATDSLDEANDIPAIRPGPAAGRTDPGAGRAEAADGNADPAARRAEAAGGRTRTPSVGGQQPPERAR